MSELLPELLDAKSLAAEFNVTRAAAEAIMRQLPSVHFPGLRKVYVKRPDVEALLERCTYSKDQVAP
jgi:antirestriction protein